MSTGLADRILVWWYSDTGAYTWESCDWYSPDSLWRLHFEVAQFIQDQLAEFLGWFNLAEFPDIEEQLEPSEVAVFLKAAGAPDDTDFSSFDDYDSFEGFRAVIRSRLEHGTLERLKMAAELFNWVIDFGLFTCDTKAHAVLRVGSVEEVAPFLLERILSRLPSDTKQGKPAYQDWPSGVEQRFLPLAPVLTMLKEAVECADWVQNELALRIFFWTVEIYKLEVENEAG